MHQETQIKISIKRMPFQPSNLIERFERNLKTPLLY